MGVPRVRLTQGPVGSGKTAALVEQACELLRLGVAAADVLVVAPGADAVDELRSRLEAAAGIALSRGIRTSSVRALALDVLSTRGAGPSDGAEACSRQEGAQPETADAPRSVRVLSHAERSIFLADLRAHGFPAKQVSAALAAAQSAWRLGDEALRLDGDACLTALLDELGRRGALLQEALFARAIGCLSSADTRCGEAMPRGGARFVLVDDADLLPPAALRLCTALAGEELWVAQSGNVPCIEATEPPVELDAPVHRLGARRACVVKWSDAAEEAAGIAAFARQAIERLALPGELFIACPNRTWVRRINDSLGRAGITVCASSDRPPLSGDPRDAVASAGLRAFAALGVLANPLDVASWRTWCAVGRSDVAAPAWRRLSETAKARGMSLDRAIGPEGRGPCTGENVSGADRLLAERIAAGWELVEKCSSKRGRALLEAIGAKGAEDLLSLVADDRGSVGPADDAHVLFARAVGRVVEQRFGHRGTCVRVGSISALAGLHPRILVLAGCNDGLADERLVRDALARPCDELLVSYVQRMPADVARRQGACVRRTRQEAGETVALLAPSPAIAALGAEAPSTVGGEQFISTTLHLRP
ncbi:MAG: hypothetical protein KHY83_10140 [Coriobacteriia bacterium]|nr:hypothetical protein [Coriobacteriia bacterium]